MKRLSLLPPRKVPWPLKPLSSAQTSLGYDSHGRMVCSIEHQLLAGISPQMLVWWFRNIGGDMDLDGQRIPKYLVWHPIDHIHWELAAEAPDGGAGVGARFRIVEAFGGDIAYLIDVTDEVLRLDETGVTLVSRLAGIEMSRLNHDFIATADGTLYRSTLTIGTALPAVARLVNPLIHRFSFTVAMGHAWLRHNVEEVGALEHIIPLLGSHGDVASPTDAAGVGMFGDDDDRRIERLAHAAGPGVPAKEGSGLVL